MHYLMWVLIAAVVVVSSLVMWRFFMLRSRGNTVVLRHMPAEGVHGWRHGTISYRGENLDYYKLRSLSPMADLVVHRSQVSVLGRREMSPAEATFLPDNMHILDIEVNDVEYEMAINASGEMALTAWVESAPDKRQQRMDPKYLRKHMPPH